MRFLNALFWELVQNIPVIVLFVVAVWLWAQHSKWKAMLCALAGAASGSLAIYLTEPLTTNQAEPIKVLFVNIVILSVLLLLFTIYLGTEANWSNKKTDLLLGALAGGSVAVAQSLAEQEPPGLGDILHLLALALASSVVLVIIRGLKDKSLAFALANSLLVALGMTVIIGVLDYSYMLLLR